MGAVEHVNVLIIGAGLSGIGAACHLQADCPGKTFSILESRGESGGTWDLFRYPGIRSDSDMFTLGYAFRPWREAKSIADGRLILNYIRETAREYGIEQKIRYNRRVVHASWSSEQAQWTVEVERTDVQPPRELDLGDAAEPSAEGAAEPVTSQTEWLTCDFLYANTGYYRYDEGYTPHFEGIERFTGQIVHPQHWPEDLDYAGKRVVVIGSGATAVTLVPALAKDAAHVTMLQRSPSYIISLPARDPIADSLRRALPAKVAAPIVRWKNVLLTTLSFQLSRRRPKLMRAIIRKGQLRQLPVGYDVDTHFAPTYQPWDQRLCIVPDGDLFTAIHDGRASVVTDRVTTFTETGVQLESGVELQADVIITATGLNLMVLGGIGIDVDGQKIDLGETVGYKGMMLSGVPNLALTIGYTNASWTLKADLAATYVCRLLNHMDEKGYRQVMPLGPDPAQPTEPFIDLASGYVLRSLGALPKQGNRKPWRLNQNYPRDVLMLKYGSLEDEAIEFSRAGSPVGSGTR